MDRRKFMTGAAGFAVLLAAPGFAQEAFPSHAITIINAFPPGGANDAVTRPLASALEPILRQPVVVDTKAGAAGQVGAQVAATAKADGYTLLSHNNGISGYAEVDKLFGREPKTTRTDFIPLARLSADPVLLLVNDQQPYKTLKDFVDDAKQRPDTIVYSSGGLYGASHLPVALLEKATAMPKLRHLPTNGGGPAITAVLGTKTPVSSTKGYTGHTLGAAGITEALVAIASLVDQWIPANINCAAVDPALGSAIVRESRAQRFRVAMSNSFGFGGSNCALVFGAAR